MRTQVPFPMQVMWLADFVCSFQVVCFVRSIVIEGRRKTSIPIDEIDAVPIGACVRTLLKTRQAPETSVDIQISKLFASTHWDQTRMNHQADFIHASCALYEKCKWGNEQPLRKLERMQQLYLQETSAYSEQQVEAIHKALQAVNHKFILVGFHLEQLWALRECVDLGVLNALTNSIEHLVWDDCERLIGSSCLESFLFQARSFLDIYMLYSALIMNRDFSGMMSWKRFQKVLKSASCTSFEERANQLLAYFQNQVFGKERWGDLVRSLRDRIAHRDYINPSFESKERIMGGILLDIPTLRGQTYDNFCQTMQNGLFELVRSTSPILYCLV